MRFLHTADWQLGMTRHFLNGEAQPRYSAGRREAVAALADVAAETGAEFVVVAGDVFESNQLHPREVSLSLEAMRGIGVPVYLLPGNHDPLDAGSVYRSALFRAECPTGVRVLDGRPVEVRPGVQIVSAPWTSKRPTEDLLGGLLRGLPADGVVRIAVGHGGVDVFEPDREKAALIRLDAVEDAVARGAVHYVALGDKHSRMAVGGTGRVWYSGSPEVTNYDHVEPDPGHVLVVDLDLDDTVGEGGADDAGGGRARGAVDVTARRLGRWRFITLRRAMDTSRDVADLDVNLDQLPDKERTVVQVALTGTLSVTDKARLDDCLIRYGRRFAALTVYERGTDLAVAPADGEFGDLGIGGFAADAVQELMAAARDGAEHANGALALLLRLSGKVDAA